MSSVFNIFIYRLLYCKYTIIGMVCKHFSKKNKIIITYYESIYYANNEKKGVKRVKGIKKKCTFAAS